MEQLVHVVDDDALVRGAIAALAESIGLRTRQFASAEDFIAEVKPGSAGCVVTDIRMRGMNGVELQEKADELGIRMPFIVISAYASTQLVVRVMKNGAVTMLEKPFDDQQLLDAVNAALEQDRRDNAGGQRSAETLKRLAALTPGEREVLDLVVTGATNKAIAFDLGVSLRTVEGRRHKVLKKLGCESVAELVRLMMEVGALERSAS